MPVPVVPRVVPKSNMNDQDFVALVSHKGKKLKSYSISFKLDAIQYAKQNSKKQQPKNLGLMHGALENGVDKKLISSSSWTINIHAIVRVDGSNAF